MPEKDYTPCLVAGVKRARLRFSPLPAIRYGTKVLNLKTQEIGLLICTWKNKFADTEIDCLGFPPRSESFAYEPSVQVSSISSYK